jgi:hypothetical protein
MPRVVPAVRSVALSVAAAVALLALPPAAVASGEVLVAVQPASESLTRATHTKLLEIVEWTFKAPLTADQRSKLSEIVIREWRDPKEREGLKEWLGLADHVASVPEAQRPNLREQLLLQILPALRDSAKTDADARWFLGVYEAANRPIAAGSPPLTRQASDALVEMLFFMMGQGHGMAIEPGPAERDEMARSLAAAWSKLPAERRKEIANAPVQWAGLRASWDVSSAADRAQVAAQWRKDFPLPQADGHAGAQGAAAPLVASPAARQALAKLKEIDAWLAQPGTKPADQLLRHADALRPLLAQLGKEPGAKQVADQVAAVEAALRKAATPPPASSAQRATASNDSARNAAAINGMMAAQRSQMQFMEQMRMSQFNMIQNLGNSPYRYTNSYGRPY